MSDNAYHDHLDVCRQCREHPFNLCPVGAAKLQEVALESKVMINIRKERQK